MYEHYRPGSSFTGGRLADRVEARLDELKAENAKLRGFVEHLASQSTPSNETWMSLFVEKANELLNELEVTA